MKREQFRLSPWVRRLPVMVFLAVIVLHALYLRRQAASPTDGWVDVGVGGNELWGFAPYMAEQDYLLGISYAVGAAFSVWALGQYLKTRQTAMAAGAAGGVTMVGVLMALGCYLVGCCGSPMLGVYLGLFGAKALGIGKPLTLAISVLSVALGYRYLRRKSTKEFCDANCGCIVGSGNQNEK